VVMVLSGRTSEDGVGGPAYGARAVELGRTAAGEFLSAETNCDVCT
jgi:hypothetical protein